MRFFFFCTFIHLHTHSLNHAAVRIYSNPTVESFIMYMLGQSAKDSQLKGLKLHYIQFLNTLELNLVGGRLGK